MVRGPRARAILSEHAARHGFTVTAARTAPAGGVGVSHQRLPRIGLYRPWTGNIDEGWTRWLFEQYGISYTTLLDNDFKKGALRQRFDVIVLPDAEAASILRGIDSTRIPAQYAGGVGEAGANTVSAPARGLATYPAQPLRSGYARFQERLAGKAALVEAPVGSGRVILFGFRPQFRGQTHGTFKLLFNAVLLAAP